MLCTAAVFSDTKGIFNAYYTVALAPAVAAVAGAGAVALWRLGRDNRWLCLVLPAAVAGSAVWAGVLFRRSPGYAPGLATGILVAGIVASIGLLCLLVGRPSTTAGRWLGAGGATIGSLALLAGPLAYSVTSIQQGTSGPLALAGPAVAGGLSPIPGMTISAASIRQSSKAASHPSSSLVRYLKAHRHGAQYLVAVSGSLTGAPYIISTGQPVMAMGGYTGMDPWPTLAAFKTVVAQGRVHYVLVGSALPSLGFGGKSFRITPAFLHEIAGFIAELKKHPRALASNLFGSNRSGPNAVDQWTRTHGVAIPPGAYGGISGDVLYYVSPLSTKL